MSRHPRPLRTLALLVFSVLLLLPLSAAAQDGAIEGTVLSSGGQAISSANVVLESDADTRQGTSTGADGTFAFRDLSAGTYTLTVSSVGYESAARTVRLDGARTASVTIRLSAARYGLQEVVVSATRSEERVQDVPTSISVLGRESLGTQLQLTTDIGDVLAQEVPGLASSTHSLSNFGQTLRGRSLFVLIDGVPQSAPLRNVLRGLRTVDASAIERVEVVRGASATYGYGGNGGLVNIITKRPEEPGVHGEVEVGLQAQPTNVESSTSGRLRGQVEVVDGPFDGLVSASYEGTGYSFDGDGDRIPQDPQGQGGLDGSTAINVLARGGVELSDQQRLDLSVNLYRFRQDLEYQTVPGVPDTTKARAQPADDVQGENPGTRNVVGTLTYEHDNLDALAGSALTARLFLQDYETRFGFASFFPDGGGQSVLESQKIGARVDVTTPLTVLSGSELQWGVDALRDETAQPLEDGRDYVPPIRQWSAAPFAQLTVPLFDDRIRLRGGARYESFWLSVDDYTTLFGGRRVGGGDLTYDAFVFNAGFVATLVDGLDAFGGFSQGYSVADVGRVLRSPPTESGFTVDALRPDAQLVDSYELGFRGGTGRFNASITGFLNTSDRGSTLSDFPELSLVRAPERVYGLEATVDAQVDPFEIGGTATVMQGKTDADDDGNYGTYLPNSRIPPEKVTGYVALAPSDRWSIRAQVLYSGQRDPFEGDAATAFGQSDVESYTIVDLSASIDAGTGVVGIGIENLFDNFYFPAVSQWYGLGSGYTAAPGREVRLSYTVRF